MLNEPCALAFVSGSEEEREKQKSEIRKYYKREHDIPSSDIVFLSDSDWDRFFGEKWKEWKEKDTKDKDTKKKGTMVITDLRVFSRDPNNLAKTLCDIIVERRIRVEIIKEEHFNKLRTRLYGKYPEELLWNEGYRERVLLSLKKVCCDILKDDDK